jgi:hypothetical protein
MSAKQFAYSPLTAGIHEVRGSWGWFLALGILFNYSRGSVRYR